MVAMKDFELLLVRGLRRPGHIVTGDRCRPVERGARLQPGWPLVRGPEPGGDAGSLEFSFEVLARERQRQRGLRSTRSGSSCVRRSTASSARTTPLTHTKVSRRLFDEVRNAPARGTCTVELNRLSARVKASKQTPKSRRAARVAEVTLRYQPVALPCPGAAPVALWVVHAREERPPPKAEALEWFVLTTLPVTSTADAPRILQWYTLRWRIEDYFRILKSGCKVEELQHHTAERLERAIAIKMVVGWRIQLMVRLGREVPELPSELLFSDGELRVLATFARSRELPHPERLGDAVGLVARLGGWLGRTRDPPGAQLMWHGYTQLVPMAFAFELRDEYG